MNGSLDFLQEGLDTCIVSLLINARFFCPLTQMGSTNDGDESLFGLRLCG